MSRWTAEIQVGQDILYAGFQHAISFREEFAVQGGFSPFRQAGRGDTIWVLLRLAVRQPPGARWPAPSPPVEQILEAVRTIKKSRTHHRRCGDGGKA